jgi:hypothetical protein
MHMHDQAIQTAFEMSLDANECWPSPHRPPLPGRMRASPALASIDLHAWLTHQRGRYLNLLFYSKAWTRQTAVRGNFYWTSPLLSSAVGYIHKVLHTLVKSASSHNVFFYGMEKVGSSRQSHSFFLHQKFDKRHLKTEIVPAGPSLLSLVWIYPGLFTRLDNWATGASSWYSAQIIIARKKLLQGTKVF